MNVLARNLAIGLSGLAATAGGGLVGYKTDREAKSFLQTAEQIRDCKDVLEIGKLVTLKTIIDECNSVPSAQLVNQDGKNLLYVRPPQQNAVVSPFQPESTLRSLDKSAKAFTDAADKSRRSEAVQAMNAGKFAWLVGLGYLYVVRRKLFTDESVDEK